MGVRDDSRKKRVNKKNGNKCKRKRQNKDTNIPEEKEERVGEGLRIFEDIIEKRKGNQRR